VEGFLGPDLAVALATGPVSTGDSDIPVATGIGNAFAPDAGICGVRIDAGSCWKGEVPGTPGAAAVVAAEPEVAAVMPAAGITGPVAVAGALATGVLAAGLYGDMGVFKLGAEALAVVPGLAGGQAGEPS
jgi:hypothetical protein